MSPIAWLAQLPALASAPTAAVPAISNAVITTVAASGVAVGALAGGVAAPPPPSTSLEAVTDVIDVDEIPFVLSFNDADLMPTPTPGEPTPSEPRESPREPASETVDRRTPTPTPTATAGPSGFVIPTPTPEAAPATITGAEGDVGQPTPSPTPTPTDQPSRPTVGPRPTSTPAPTRSPTPLPSPTPTTAPTSGPVSGVWYLTNPGQGETTSSNVLDLSASAPTLGGTLPNYDTNRDNEPGLRIKKNGTIASSTNASDSQQLWQLQDAGTVDAHVTLSIFAAKQGAGSDAVLFAALVRCATGDLTNCTAPLATGTATVSNELSGAGSFEAATIDLGSVSITGPTNKPVLVLRVVAGSRHVHLAYDHTMFPASLTFG